MLQKVTFTSGMDSDISPEFMAPGKARKRLNVRVLSSDNDQIGGIETVLGNELVSYTLPKGNNQVIGSKEDPKENKIYYFLWNSDGLHQILEYNYSNDAIKLVLKEATVAPTYLNFSLDHLITGINIVELDPETRLLYWTDDYVDPSDPDVYNEPKKLNIEKAKAHSAGDYVNGYTSPFEPRFITRIKQPPLHAPTYEWSGTPPPPPPVGVVNATITPTNAVFIQSGFGAHTLRFNTDPGSPANGYDTSTFRWTVPVGGAGDYNFQASVSLLRFSSTVPCGNVYVRIWKFTPLGSFLVVGQYFSPGTVGLFAVVGLNQVSVAVGDQFYAEIELADTGNGSDYKYTPYSFIVENYVPDTPFANFLNKKFFTFKTQFAYDDRELSAWSPISPTFYPKTRSFPNGSGEDLEYTDNKITITVPTGSSIVKRIRIAVKEFGSTEFSLLTDLSKEILSIPDDSTYDFEFINEGNYVQLESTESNRLFDFVPQRSKSQELIAGNRIVDGNITENFDPVKIDLKLPLSFEEMEFSSTNPWFPLRSYLKSGGSYNFGIVYYDYFGNRSGLTNVTDGQSNEYVGDRFGTILNIPFLISPLYGLPNTLSYQYMEYIPKINFEIYNNPPKWASHYQILRSKNKTIRNFVQFVAQSALYLDSSGVITPSPITASFVAVNISNITGRYKQENPNSQLVYDYSVGDRCRFIANANGTIPSFSAISYMYPENDQEILGYDAGTGEIIIRMDVNTPVGIGGGTLFEIYSPAESSVNNNEIMYEIAEEGELIQDINGNLVHSGSISNQQISDYTDITNTAPDFYDVTLSSAIGFTVGDKVKIVSENYSIYGVVDSISLSVVTVDATGYTMIGTYSDSTIGTLVKSAESVLMSGDCFRRYCDMPWVSVYTGNINRLYSYVESLSASYLFTSNVTDYARPNIIDPEITRVTRPSTIYWSEFLVPETNINGLSTVYDQSFESYEQRYGGIQKLFNENMGLVMLQELKCAMVPVQRIIYGDLSLQNTVGASTSVLSPQAVYYAGEFGIGRNPESFAVYGSAKYFIDVSRAVVLRLSNDGLTPISDTASMHNYFTDKCRFININGGTKIFGAYDIKFNEYIIAFSGMVVPEPAPAIAAAETLAWNERANQWSTFYSYHPEGMCGSNTGIVSFYAGDLYKHNVNTTYNKFYGETTPSEFWVICNESPSNVKILLAISEETNSPWEVYSITTPNGQQSNLIPSDFQEKENNQYAALWKDELTPNVVHPLINGDVMRDRTFLAKFRYRESVYNKINAVNFEIITSNLSNR